MTRTRRPRSLMIIGSLLFIASSPGALPGRSEAAARVSPPVAEKKPHTAVLHGETLSDDYRWLREKSDPAVAAYLQAENAYAEAMLKGTRKLEKRLYKEMLARIKETDLTVPFRRGGHLYYSRTEAGRQYPIYCRKKGSTAAPEEIILDVNRLAEGQTFMGIGALEVSDDGNLLAYSTDNTGFRQYALHVRDLRTGRDLPDTRKRVVSVAWAADNATLFYTVEDDAKRSHRLYRHALGDAEDDLVYEESDERFRIGVRRTRSGDYLVLGASSHTTSEARLLPAGDPAGTWRVVAPRQQDREYEVEHRGDRLYIRVNDTGRNFRLVSAPAGSPGPESWTEMRPHRPDVMIEGIDAFATRLVVYERQDGLARLRVLDPETGAERDVAFPEPAYEVFPSNNEDFSATAYRYSYQSLVTPPSVYDYDFAKETSSLLKRTEVLGGYDPARYRSERIHATAADGTRVPASLVYRQGLAMDGRAPLLLQGYGSYGYTSPATFSSNNLSLLDRGMIVAIAHVRGGGEMGKPWHDQGRMKHKMNTFTDFIAVAEHLIARKYTASDRLVIAGGSAGGLLMGAVTNLRPDLFRAVVSYVPFVDVLNTMSDPSLPLTVGEFEEWGNPANEEDYRTMRRYCPYTNLKQGDYPAMLVKTSFNDSQVMYWEPAKYVARLRTLKTDPDPLLLVTNMAGGHGGSSGRYDRLRERALDYAFVLDQVGLAKAR